MRTNQPAQLTILTGPERAAPGLMLDLSGRGMRIALQQPVEVGAAARVDLAGSVLLGEVCYCQRDGERYIAGLALEQELTMTAQLLELRDSILSSGGEPSGAAGAAAAARRRPALQDAGKVGQPG